MPANEEASSYGLDQGCAVHGDENMRECSMCGTEFCRLCHPKSTVCPDCADQDEDDDTDEPDFDDVSNLDEVLDEDEESKEEEAEEDVSDDLADDDKGRDY